MAISRQSLESPIWTEEELRKIVRPDPVRPGLSRYRVVIEEEGVNLPIWPLIGQLRYAYGWNPDERRPQLDNVLRVAGEYGLPLIAMEAAILYYQEHRAPIDGWLADNQGTLADFLGRSPLRGANITLDRLPDESGPIDL